MTSGGPTDVAIPCGEGQVTQPPDVTEVEESASSTMRQEHIPQPRTPEQFRDEVTKQYTEEDSLKAWQEAAESVKIYHDELVARWKEEMDNLLVYAGLFSAVLTAFNVESYQLLQPNSADSTLAVLQQISAQLNSFTVTNSFVNATQQATSLDALQPPFRASASAVWLNTLWFSSLVCSLASASIALMVKQWLHGLETGLSGTSRESARLRQYRLNGLLKWRVNMVVMVLPILLQVALILFLIGLVILLWTLHGTVAAVTSSLVGALLVFVSIATVLPAFKWDCCYRSPQALLSYEVIRAIYNPLRALILELWMPKIPSTINTMPRRGLDGVTKNPDELIAQISETLDFLVYELVPEMPTWAGREQLAISTPATAKQLDLDVAIMAYTTSFSSTQLTRAPAFFPHLGVPQVARYLNGIWAFLERHWGTGNMSLSSRRIADIVQQLPLRTIRYMLSGAPALRGPEWTKDMRSLLSRLRYMPRTSRDRQLYLETVTQVAIQCDDSEVVRDALHWVLLDLRYAEDLHSYTYETVTSVLAMARQVIQGFSRLRGTPHAYVYAAEVVVHCMRLTSTCDPPLLEEQRKLVQRHGEDALRDFDDLFRTWQTSEPLLLGPSNHLDGQLLSSFTVVLQTLTERDMVKVVGIAQMVRRVKTALDAAKLGTRKGVDTTDDGESK